MEGGTSSLAKSASSRSIEVGRKATRFRHMSTCPVKPWMTYSTGKRRSGSAS